MRRLHVVINPGAGQPKPVLYTLNRVFRAAGVAWDVSITHSGGDACRAAKAAAAGGADVVAVCGGDGTVLEAATGLLGTGTPLAILPGGTANLLAVELGIPLHLRAAAEVACAPDSAVRRVDMGRSGERYFIQRLSIGLDAEKVNRATRELKQRYGRLAYAIGWLEAAREAPVARYTLRLDGEEVTCDGVTCHVANSGTIGIPGLSLLPDIQVADGLLDVLVIRDTRIGTAVSLARLAAHQPADPEAFHHWQDRKLSVATDPPQPIQADGEMWGATPMDLQVVPGAVGILAAAVTSPA